MSETDSGDNVRRIGNGFDPDIVKGYVDRIERLDDDLAHEKGVYMEACKVIHEQRAGVIQEAKDQHGISKRALKTVVKVRGLEERAERLREELEPEIQDGFDQIRLALGDYADTPLGGAALAKAPDRPSAA